MQCHSSEDQPCDENMDAEDAAVPSATTYWDPGPLQYVLCNLDVRYAGTAAHQ